MKNIFFKKLISLSRIALSVFFIFSVLLFSFVGIFYIGLFTDKGRHIISNLIVNSVQDDNFQLEIGPVTGSPPTPLRFEYIYLKDSEGIWGKIENLELIWNPISLFRGKIHVESLTSSKINLLRLPQSDKSKDFNFSFDLPRLPFSFALQKFIVKELEIAEEVMGNKMLLALDANLHYGFLSPKILANLKIQDDSGLDVVLNLDYNQSHKNLNVFTHLFDPGEGAFSKAMGFTQATNIVLKGSGLTSDWRGDLTSNLGQQVVLLGDFSLIPENGSILGKTNLSANFFGELKPFWKKVIEDHCVANARFILGPKGLRASQMGIESPVFKLNFDGSAEITKDNIQGTGKTNLSFLKPYSFFELNGAPYPLKTNTHVDLSFKGNWDSLDINIDGDMKSDPLNLAGFGLTKDIDLGIQAELFLKNYLTKNLEVEIDADCDLLGFTPEKQIFIDPRKWMLKFDAVYKDLDDIFTMNSFTLLGDDLTFQGAFDFRGDELVSCALHGQHQNLARLDPNIKGNGHFSLTKEKEAPDYHFLVQSDDFHFKEQKFEDFLSEIHFKIQGQKTLGDVSIHLGDAKPFKLSSQFDYGKDILKLQKLTLGSADSVLDGSLSFDFSKNLLLGNVKGSLDDIGFLDPFLNVQDLKGKIICDLIFDQRPQKDKKNIPHLLAQIRLKEIRAEGEKVFDVHHGVLRAELFDYFQKIKGKINGTILDAQIENFMISQGKFQLEGDWEAAHLTANVKGAKPFSYDMNLVGHLDNQADQTLLQLSKLEGSIKKTNYNLTKPLALTYAQDHFSFPHTHFRIGKGVLAGSLNYTPQKAKMQVSWMDIPADLLEFALPSFPLQGGLHGKIDLTKNDAELKGSIELETDKLLLDLGEDVNPVFYSKILGNIKGEDLVIDGLIREEKLKDSDFKLKGKIPLHIPSHGMPNLSHENTMDMQCSGHLNLNHLSPFLPTYEDILEGTLKGEVKLSGKIQEPKLDGKIDLVKGYYENAQFGTILDNVQAHFVAKNDEIILDQFSAQDTHKGDIKGKGKFSFLGDRPYLFNLVLNDFQIINNEESDIRSYANLNLKGQKDQRNVLEGKVDITKAQVKIPEKLAQGEDDFFDDEDYCVEEAKAGSSKINLDLDVALKAPLRLTGFGLESEWFGACKVTGDLAKPRIMGKVKAQKGSFSLFGPTFTLTQGNVYFNGGDKIIPEIYILAETKSADLVARLNITGNVTRPKIELTSSPALPQDEILSRLLFKHGTADLSPIQAVKLGHMLNKINGTKLPLFEQFDKIQNILGLEDFEIGVNDEDGKTASPVLKAGHRINDKVKVTVEEDLRKRKTHGKLQVELTPHVNLETGVSNDLQGNVGVFGKWDY